MKKTDSLTTVIAMVITMSAVEALANPKVNKAHAPLRTTEGKAINCAYCHGPIAKKKGQGMMKKQAQYERLAKVPACSGAGCHN